MEENAETMKSLKIELRRKILAQRDLLSEEFVREKSEAISKKILALPEVQNAKRIGVYLSFRNEIDTRGIIESLLSQGKEVFVPAVDFNDSKISFAKFTSFDSLALDSHGVPEPREKEFVSSDSIDVFLVPGIAFDSENNRLGWGKGFYDKFFNETNARGKKIGLAYSFQRTEKIPCGPHDVKMDFVVFSD